MTIPSDPHHPCPCNSSLPYSECHQPVMEAPDEDRLAIGHQEYALRWKSRGFTG
ncbi:SEC-C metal-binding domain-containing protein [Rhizobium sullae]|uniref:SEC-C metal-binding domain-containing protein n=1 Tax=Rhizobium sullae TaxID=50338 RepID=UPI00104F1BA6